MRPTIPKRFAVFGDGWSTISSMPNSLFMEISSQWTPRMIKMACFQSNNEKIALNALNTFKAKLGLYDLTVDAQDDKDGMLPVQ
jgi:hypothetical protein